MPPGQFRYEKAIADTAKAVASLRADYFDLDSPSPRTYIGHLRDEYQGHGAHAFADSIMQLHKKTKNGQYFSMAAAWLGTGEELSDTDLLDHDSEFGDGFVLGLAATNETVTTGFDDIMSEQLNKLLTPTTEMPQNFSRRISAIGMEAYEFDLDCPAGVVEVAEDERPQHLKGFANQLLSADLYDKPGVDKYFKIGLGIARRAYNNYIILGENDFTQMMAGITFNFDREDPTGK